MATPDEYAAWIVKNADKKGTPEFETVASAYKASMTGTPPAAAPATPAPTLKGSSAGGVFMGLRDPIDAGAQMLVHALPDGVVKAGNALNNKLVDWGVPGIARLDDSDTPKLSDLVTGKKVSAASPLDDMVRAANTDYETNRAASGRDGLDVARIAGNVLNPVNRVVPVLSVAGKVGSAARAIGLGAKSANLIGVGTAAGAQGAISGLATPVEGDTSNLIGSKLEQAGIGAAGGAAGGVVADKLFGAVAQKVAAAGAKIKNMVGGATMPGGMTPDAYAQQVLESAARDNGFDLATIPASIVADVRSKVADALKKGETLDPKAMARIAAGKAVLGDDAGLMLGQATRDPHQFASELNLRGVENAGKPIADRLALQNQRLIGKVNEAGAGSAPDAYDAGKTAYTALKAHDDALSQGVGDAYDAFRKSTGSAITVPLQPVAQRFGEVLDTYGAENLPAAVRAKFDSYGLTGGKQTKVFDLAEADKLIKIINANYDPMKAVQAGALGQLRKGLSESIDLAGEQSQGATGPASDLLRTALGKAKDRFSLHEMVPALEAAAKDPGAQEKFVRDFVTGQSASIDQVTKLATILPPEALDSVRKNVLSGILEKAAPGATGGSDSAKFSQAGFRKALDAIGDRKLEVLYGKEGLANLRNVQRVAEWIQSQPAGSAVNNSNTGSAVANLLQGLSGKTPGLLSKIMSAPGLNVARNSLAQSLDDSAVGNAIGAKVRPQPPEAVPVDVNPFRRFLPGAAGAFGGASATSLR